MRASCLRQSLSKFMLRWDGVTAHAVFDGILSAMPPDEEGYQHQWKRDMVISALKDNNKLLAAGNILWGGNPLQNLTAAAELLCWKEAAISVFGCVQPAPAIVPLVRCRGCEIVSSWLPTSSRTAAPLYSQWRSYLRMTGSQVSLSHASVAMRFGKPSFLPFGETSRLGYQRVCWRSGGRLLAHGR